MRKLTVLLTVLHYPFANARSAGTVYHHSTGNKTEQHLHQPASTKPLFMRKLFSLFLCLLIISSASAQLPDLTSAATTYNQQTLPAGSYVIAMDNTNQSTTISSTDVFNVKAYGLAIHLLNNNYRLRWIIKPGKTKDAADFTVNATRFKPTLGTAASLSFKAGPFVIFASDTAGIYQKIDQYNSSTASANKVNVYRTNADVTVDVRFDYQINGVIWKPKAALLDDGGNADIHQTYMTLAGVPATNFSVETSAANLNTSCFTFASEPHNSTENATIISAIKTFVQYGGNFLAQCEAVRTYENSSAGRFQTTRADANATFEKGAGGNNNFALGTLSNSANFPAAYLPFSQFEGSFNADKGGSLKNWRLTTGSTFNSTGHAHIHGGTSNTVYAASASKLVTSSQLGGMVYYLSQHDFGDATSTQSAINGHRMYMNALMTPTNPQGSIRTAMVVNCMNTLSDPTNVILNVNNAPTAALPMTFNLYADVSQPYGAYDAGDILLGTQTFTAAGGAAKTISVTNQYKRNVPYVINVIPSSGCLQSFNLLAPQCSNTLPVSFKSFTTKRNKQNVVLNWQTATELNNAGFAIERNVNGNWAEIAFVPSQANGGNSSTELNYTYNDLNSYKGISQYRIRQDDPDSKTTYSVIRSVQGEGAGPKLVIYPNPSMDGRLQLVFEDANSTRHIVIIDMNGRIVRQLSNVSNSSISIDGLNVGLYTARVINQATGESTLQKFVIQQK